MNRAESALVNRGEGSNLAQVTWEEKFYGARFMAPRQIVLVDAGPKSL